jgi:hypothetical protein
MSTLVQTFEDFPLTFLEHQNVPYISHRSLSDYFKWSADTRRRRFKKIAENHPEMVAYFQCDSSRGMQILHPSTMPTEEYNRLNSNGKITRCLARQGLILALVKEDGHPRAREFQKFACAVLDSYMTHGEIGPHEANNYTELTAKINAENEARRLDVELTRVKNDRLRIEFDGKIKLKQLDIQEKKVENTALIEKTQILQSDITQAVDLRAYKCIFRIAGLPNNIPNYQFKRVSKFVYSFAMQRYVEKKHGQLVFKSRVALNAARPLILRQRFLFSRRDMTMEYAHKHSISMFK